MSTKPHAAEELAERLRLNAEVEYLSAEQLAERLNLSYKTILRRRKEGVIPAIELSSKCFRFEWPDCLHGLREDDGPTVIM